MDSSLIALMILSLFLGCGCWLLFLWAVRDGQFTDIERPKHRMLDDEESCPPREKTGRGVGSCSEETDLPLPDPPPPGEGVARGVDIRKRALSPSPGGGVDNRS